MTDSVCISLVDESRAEVFTDRERRTRNNFWREAILSISVWQEVYSCH